MENNVSANELEINESLKWPMIKLKRFITIKDGTHDTPEYIDNAIKGVPLITSKNIINGNINFSEAKLISYADYKAINKRSNVEYGDVIMPMIGTIGNPTIVETKMPFSIKNVALFKTNGDIIKAKYIKFVLGNYIVNEQLEFFMRGGVQNFVSLDILGNIVVPRITTRCLAVIVKYLDNLTLKIDSIIINKEKQNAKLTEYRQSVITEVITKGLNPKAPVKDSGIEWIGKMPSDWTVKRIKYVACGYNGDRGIGYPSGDDFVDKGIPFITTYELNDGKVSLSNVQYITEEKYNKLGGLKIKKGDIIYCLRGSVGKTGLSDFDTGTIASSLMGIRCRDTIMPKFLNYLLNSKIEEQERKYLTTGSVSANLAAEDVMQFEFAFPNLREQKEILKFLDTKTAKIDSIISKNNDIIAKLKEYRQSIIYEVVTGKRKVC